MELNNNSLKRDKLSTMSQRESARHKQKGVVLIVTLVFLVALTGVAGALMQSTTSDMKMTSASNEKVIATQAAISGIDEIVDNQINQRDVNLFAGSLQELVAASSAELLPADSKIGAEASAAMINNPTFEEKKCLRGERGNGNDEDTRTCNIFELRVTRAYGRNDTSTVSVNALISQELTVINQ